MHMNLVGVAVVLGITACGCLATDEIMAPRQPAIASVGGDGGAGDESFGGTVQPILLKYCSKCHNTASVTGGLDVSSYETIIAAGVVEPGKPDGSLMIQYLEGGVMPPAGNTRPTDEEIAAIRAWVGAGAPNN